MDTLVNWRQWGREAFEEAGRDDKLILLDVSAVWCHWCHTMDKTTYSNPDAAEVINTRFVPVRVDTDRMPDVNERYNMGGWPTTAVLTPAGEVLVGATYMTPGRMKKTLVEIDEFYAENRDALLAKIEELKNRKATDIEEALAERPGELSTDIVAYVMEEVDRGYDRLHGGFGEEPKFPAPEAIDLLLTRYADTGRREYLDMADNTLDAMAAGGLFDHVEGGFFRYATRRDWSEPHYEKMLEVNAGLIMNYLNSHRMTGNPERLETAMRAIEYVDAWLWSDKGYFYASQDADEEYYRLPAEERKRRDAPAVDKTLFAGLNARMAQAYLAAWELTRDDAVKEKGLRALDTLVSRLMDSSGGFHHYRDENGSPKRLGLLTDQAPVLRALLYAYQLTSERKWSDAALSLVRFMETRLWDEAAGGFWDIVEEEDAVGALAYRAKPVHENADASVSLGTLYVLTGDERYRGMAGKCLLPFTRLYREYSHMGASYALAADFLLSKANEVTLAGEVGSPGMEALSREAGQAFVPRRVLRMMDFARDKEELARRGYSAKAPAAFICRDFVCTSRITDPGKLREELRRAA